MKILFDMANRSDLVCINLYDLLAQEMAKIADVKMWGPKREGFVREPLEATIKRLYGNDSPDWIITTAFMLAEDRRWFDFVAPPKEKRPWRIATFTSDIHANHMIGADVVGYAQALNKANFDAILMLYTHVAYSKRPTRAIDPQYYLKNLKGTVYHCPIWVDSNLFKPSKEPPLYDVSFLAAFDSRQHPVRYSIWTELPALAQENKWDVLMRMRPPGKSNTRFIDKMKAEGHVVGDVYADALARSRVFIFGSSIYKYPLLKIVEGWMAGACVVCDEPFTAKRMHMADGENYIKVDVNNWKTKLKEILNNEPKRKMIAQKGYETAIKYHTPQVRVRELLSFLEKNR